MIFQIKNIEIEIENKKIVKGINLELKKGTVTVIMGPNGSGKSTLAHGLMGHPKLEVTGNILLDGENIEGLKPNERSQKGLFLSFQHPEEIAGVTVSNFLRTAVNSRLNEPMKIQVFVKLLNEKMKMLDVPKEFASRYVNAGFSGGEKKKMEILQMAVLNPKVAILDETDSGLDIDALKSVCKGINKIKELNKDMALLIITHYQRMLNYLKPDTICIMIDGKIIKKDGAELALELEKKGYEAFR